MRKILSAVLLFYSLTFSQQAPVDISIDVVNGGNIQHLHLGLDPCATTGIDPCVGEAIAPNPGPQGSYDIRFDLSHYGFPFGTYKDFRHGSLPYNGIVQHRLAWQLQYNADTLVFNYNIPPNIIMNFKDIFGGVLFDSGPLQGSGTYTLVTETGSANVTVAYGTVPTQTNLSIAPDTLDFGTVYLNNTSTLNASVTNPGMTPLIISGISSTNSQFTCLHNQMPITLQPGQSSTLVVVFSPLAENLQTGNLIFTHNGPGLTSSYVVKGTGYQGSIMQPAVSGSITISEQNGWGYSKVLVFGIDGTATDGIDTLLGERGMPLYPTPAYPDIRFILPADYFNGSVTSFKDFRKMTCLPFSGQIEHRISIKMLNTFYDYKISWNFPPYINGVIQDLFGFQVISMSGSGTANLSSAYDKFKLFITYTDVVSEPCIEDSIIVEDQMGHNHVLSFGMDPLATDGIDPIFNESLLPPVPPYGAFDTRLLLPENGFSGIAASYRDFRQMSPVPFTGQKEFRIAYQLGTGSPGAKISWNFPYYLSGVLQDLSGGTIVNVNMWGIGSVIINPAIDKLKMLVTYTSPVSPVELTSFTAQPNGNAVVLNWETATEKNNKGFELQRKSINSDWMKITFVQGAGTSTNRHSYYYIDNTSGSELYTYRLKQIDYNGSFTYSKEAEVNLSVNNFVLNQNYPNPFNPTTQISYSIPEAGFVTLKVYNPFGEEVGVLVNKFQQPAQYTIQFNSSGLAGGVYFYKLTSGNFTQTRKMLLLK